MTRIVWTVQAVNEGYQGFVKVKSAVLSEANGAWFSVSEQPF
jgi:redox-regulated HSP33 family molecular chaperone